MAVNSGSFTTSAVEGRSLTFNWSIASQSTTNNTTTINWNLVGSGSYSGWVTAGNFKVTIDGNQVYYSANRVNVYQGTVVASGTYTLSHSTTGTKSFQAYAEAGVYYVAVNVSGSGSWELPTIARQCNITSAPDFNDEQNPTIQYNNPAGNSVSTLQACISLTGSTDDIAYRNISKTGNSYTFELTEAERNVLRQATTSKTRSVIFYVKTIIGGSTFYSRSTKTLTIANANPTITNITYQDENATTLNITNNNQIIVRNKSDLVFNFGTITALKYATLSSVAVTINGVTKNASGISGTSLSEISLDFQTVNVSSNSTASIVVTDSRGNSTTYTKQITIANWEKPTAIFSIQRENNYYSETNITVNCTYSHIGNNAVTIWYEFSSSVARTQTGYITDGVETQFTLDNTGDWSLQFRVQDKLGNTIYTYSLSRGMPIIYFDRKLNSVGINCFPHHSNDICANGKSLLPQTLFDGSSNETITLSDSVANYSYIEIFYADNNSAGYNSTKLYSANGKSVDLSIVEPSDTSGDRTYIRRTAYAISGTTLTPATEQAGLVQISGSTVNTNYGTNYIYIYRVLGWE